MADVLAIVHSDRLNLTLPLTREHQLCPLNTEAMSEDPHTIAPHCKVTLHFSLSLANGTEAVSTYAEPPLIFTLGDGTMTEGLEQALIGLDQGANEMILLSGDEIFGPATEDKIQHIPLSDFPTELTPIVGQLISFTTPAGDELAGLIQELNGDQALVDFNHPLCGQLITFKVQILKVDPAV